MTLLSVFHFSPMKTVKGATSLKELPNVLVPDLRWASNPFGK